MIKFSLADVSNEMDQEGKNLVADLILSWARYDSLITHWTFRSFGMGPDEGSILLGNMDTQTKLNRLKTLTKHFRMDEAVASISELSKLHKIHVEVRNTICHKTCAGYMRSDPDRLIFANARVYPGQPGTMLVELLHVDQIRGAILFAKENADKIVQIVDVLVSATDAARKDEQAVPDV